MITGMNHFTILGEDERATLDFYVGLLGLTVGPRPDLGFPGAWLYSGGPQAVLHIIFGRGLPAQRAGVIDHMAFTGRDLAGMLSNLKARGIEHELRRLPEYGTWQLFFDDPNGAKVELDFDARERAELA